MAKLYSIHICISVNNFCRTPSTVGNVHNPDSLRSQFIFQRDFPRVTGTRQHKQHYFHRTTLRYFANVTLFYLWWILPGASAWQRRFTCRCWIFLLHHTKNYGNSNLPLNITLKTLNTYDKRNINSAKIFLNVELCSLLNTPNGKIVRVVQKFYWFLFLFSQLSLDANVYYLFFFQKDIYN